MPIANADTPNHCNAEWFKSLNAQDINPWLLSTDQPTDWAHRDAPLGNGLFGTRINPLGDASGYTPGSCSFMHGLWGAATDNPKRPEGMIELPHWATLTIGDGDRELRREQGAVHEHTQALNLKTATVHTRRIIDSSGNALQVERETWIARGEGDQHIAVLSAEIDVLSPDLQLGDKAEHRGIMRRIFIDEYLDAMHWPDLAEAESGTTEDDIYLTSTTSKYGHQLAIVSKLIIEGDVPERRVVTVRENGAVIRRRVQIATSPGDQIKVTKIVALVPSYMADAPLAQAQAEVQRAAADLPGLRERHEAAWAEIWKSHVTSDHVGLQLLCNASLFHLYTTLREGVNWSHGPCGLSGNGWDSSVFWDTDLWTLPVYALFNPGMAKACVAYRHHTLPGAQKNAEIENEAGARFSWMSGQTGAENCSERVFQEERHIVSCVAFAQWAYIMASGDKAWRTGEGLEVIRNCAEYWVSRAVKGEDGKYHILQICGSDEHARFVDDNATTNWGATWTLRLAKQLVEEVGETAPAIWEEIAENLVILWDEERGIPLQMASWEDGQVIKQADTTMMIHPWNYPMDQDTMAKTVEYYRKHYEENQIMMGVAIDGVVDCKLGHADTAFQCFEQLLEHFRKPYFIVSESPANDRLNFLTGLGGFMQLVCMGFAGLKVDQEDSLSAKPCLPKGINELTLHGIWHGGQRHEVKVTSSGEVNIQAQD